MLSSYTIAKHYRQMRYRTVEARRVAQTFEIPRDVGEVEKMEETLNGWRAGFSVVIIIREKFKVHHSSTVPSNLHNSHSYHR